MKNVWIVLGSLFALAGVTSADVDQNITVNESYDGCCGGKKTYAITAQKFLSGWTHLYYKGPASYTWKGASENGNVCVSVGHTNYKYTMAFSDCTGLSGSPSWGTANAHSPFKNCGTHGNELIINDIGHNCSGECF